jgi:hypothetical protein
MFTAVFLAGSCFAQQLSPAEQSAALGAIHSISAPAVRGHMRFLSDELLAGREPGTPGYDIAARYVATQMEAMGLLPAGERATYFQKVPMRASVNDEAKSSLILIRDGKEVRLKSRVDYVYGGNLAHTESSVGTPLVFVGFGVTAPELNYDDYAGVDVRGKGVVLFGNAPARFSSTQRAYYADGITKAKNAVKHGAVGYLALALPDDEKKFPWDWKVPQILAPSRAWIDSRGQPQDVFPEIQASAAINRSGAELLFQGAPHTLNSAIAAAEASRPQAFPLAVTARMHMLNAHQAIESANIVGKIEGSDPALKNQYVVYGAHVDHLGLCPPVEGSTDKVCHGTVDDASGVATVLEIARAFTRLPQSPRRSILFLFVTGEEDGLLGSDYFVHNPTVNARDIVTDINVDGAPGIRYPCKDLTPIGAEHSNLAANVARAAQLVGYELTPDPMPEQNFFIRADQYSFVRAGIPSVFIRNGADGGDVIRKWLTTRYHTPLDSMEQPLYFDAAVRAAGVEFLVGYSAALQEQRPAWNKGDFFGDMFAKKRNNADKTSP